MLGFLVWLGILLFGSFSLPMKRFLITFTDRDDTLKVSLPISSICTSNELISLLRDNLQLKYQRTFDKIEYYDSNVNKFHEITDANDIQMILKMNFIHLLITERETSGEMLQIEGRAFNLPNGLEINKLFLPIQELSLGREQGTGLNTWDGAVVLAKYLETSHGQTLIKDNYLLELGAGTGTAGLASFYLGSSLVVLTDLEYTLSNLQHNTQRAVEILRSNSLSSSSSSQALVVPLDWSDSSTYIFPSSIDSSYPSNWDVIIGADIVWLDHLVKPLVRALTSLASPSTLLLLAHQTRSHQTDQLFFSQLNEHFTIEMVPRENLDPLYSTPKINLYQCRLK